MVCSKCGELKLRRLRFCPHCIVDFIVIALGQIIGVAVGVAFVADRGDIREVMLYATVGNVLGALTGIAVLLLAGFFSDRARR